MSIKKDKEIYLITEDIRSLFNVGAFFRSADVFGVSKIFLTGYTGFPPRDEITKTALGAENWIPWESHYDTVKLIQKLQAEGIQVAALEIGDSAKPITDFKPSYPLALLVGNEVTGVSEAALKAADEVVEIPMHGQKESLNVAIAASIALHHFRNVV